MGLKSTSQNAASRGRTIPIHLRLLLISIVAGALVRAPLLGAGPADGEEIDRIQAEAWVALYEGKIEKAIKRVAPLVHSPDEAEKMEALHCLARCYWATGRGGQGRAKRIWREIGKASTLNAHRARMKIADALRMAAAGGDAKLAAAAEKLEGVVRGGLSDTCVAEAAIELAHLRAQAGRWEDAHKALSFAEAYLKKQVELELSQTAAAPFLHHMKKLHKQMRLDEDAGRELFLAAEGYRKGEKYAEAIRTYRQVLKQYPRTDYAPRSELQIGRCLAGMGQAPAAIRQWTGFISRGKVGPWRGQAMLALADLHLEGLYDLDGAGRYVDMAASTLPAALENERSKASWEEASYGIHLKKGIVAHLQDNFTAAQSAFQQARKAAEHKDASRRVDRLLTAVKANRPAAPADVRTGGAASRASLALGLGGIYLSTENFQKADGVFSAVLDGRAGGLSPAQRAYGQFGRCRVLEAEGKLEEAKEGYLACLKAYKSGSWQDETLYGVATITQDLASAKFAQAPEPANPSAKPPAVSKAEPLTVKQREAAAKAEEERLAALLKAKGEALPYWRELIKRYPKSPRVEQAMYNAGVLLCELAEVAPAAQSEKAWKEAAFMLNRLCEFYPKSLLAGDAYVRQVDIALERMFDLDLARQLSASAAEWARGMESAGGPAEALAIPAWAHRTRTVLPAAIRRAAVSNSFFCAAITAYLAADHDTALVMLNAAGPVEPPGFLTANLDTAKVGLHYLVAAIRSRKPLTDRKALDAAKTDKEKLALKLADLYLESIRPERAEQILLRVAEGDPLLGPVSRECRAYAMLQLAVALDRQAERRSEAVKWLEKLTAAEHRGTYWGGYGLFRLGVFTYNHTQDAKSSLAIYEEMMVRYPDHPMTERAHAYYCFNAVRAGEIAKAQQAAQAFQRKYPKSEWTSSIQQLIRDNSG